MLENKVALVTGASRGIGKEIALSLAKEGAAVILNYNGSKEKAESAAEEIRAAGGKAETYQCNVSDFEACGAMIQDLIKQYGKIDILVNNAGISQSTPLCDYTPEEFNNIINLNVNALFYTILPTVKIMKEQGGGCIINTSSMVSLTGQASGVGYPTSKFAVNGLTISLARELGKDNIRVNAVAPGVTKTDMVAALPDEVVKRISMQIPMGRPGEPEEVADAFLYLASDLSSYVSGEILSVDGATWI